MAHLGRPKGDDFAERAAGGPSLRVVADRLGELLGKPVAFATDLVGPSAATVVAGLADGDVALLENVRFEPAETSKDDAERSGWLPSSPRSATSTWATGSAWCTASRPRSTTCPRCCRTRPGDLVMAEVAVLQRLTQSPARPYVVVLGGSKVSDKLGVIGNLLGLADRVLIGGGMVFTFLAALGHEVGTSLLEADHIDSCKAVLADAAERGVELVLPTDIVVAPGFAADAATVVVPADAIPADQMGLDIGPASRSCSRRSWPTRGPCSGTGRWACSSSRRSPRAPGRSPRR